MAATGWYAGLAAPFTYPNDLGFDSAMLWLELARSAEEVFAILGPHGSAAGVSIRTALDRANYIDFAVMVAYPALMANALLLLRARLVRGGRVALAGRFFAVAPVALAVVMVGADVVETLQLLRLTKAVSPEAIAPGTLTALAVSTSIKWTALFVAAGAAAVAMALLYGWRFASVGAVAYGAACASGMASLYGPGLRGWLTFAAGALVLGWLSSVVCAVRLLWAPVGETSPTS